MKWILTILILVFAGICHAQLSHKTTFADTTHHSDAKEFSLIQKALRYNNMDSLEQAFNTFVKQRIDNNQLENGHELLNRIITTQNLSDTLKILAYKYKAILYGQVDLTQKRQAFEQAIQHIYHTHTLTYLAPQFQLEVAKTYLAQSQYLGATNALNNIKLAEVEDPQKKVEVLIVCGLLYAQMDDTLQSLEKLNEALLIARKHNDDFGLGSAYSAMGNVFVSKTHRYEKAAHSFRLSMNAFHKAGYDHYALGSQADIGVTYARMQQRDSAMYYLQKSYDESKKTGSIYDQSICAKELGMLYNDLKQPEMALKMCREAKGLMWKHASDNFRYTCASCLSNAYEQLHQSDSSLYYFKLYHAYKDSTLNNDESKALAKFNAELEKETFILQEKNDKLQKEQLLQTRKNTIISLSIVITLLMIIFLLTFRTVRIRKKRELIEQKEKDQREYSQQLLDSLEKERKRISMELHDSVGQMLVVAGRNLQNKQLDQVEPALQNALNEVRTISQGMHPYILEKMGLNDAIQHLIFLADNSSDMFISADIDPIHNALEQTQEIHVYRILQELISNGIKHSGSPSMEIEIRSSNRELYIRVSDKGKGIDLATNTDNKKMSLGWKTLHERVQMLEGTIHIQSQPNQGTTIIIHIPEKR